MEPSSTISPASFRAGMAAILLALLLSALDQTIVSTALPTIVGELGGITHLTWVVTGYLLAATIVGPIYGKLGDLYGRKRVIQFAMGLFLVGSVLSGLSQSMLQLVLFRALQGLGGGGLMVLTIAAVGDLVPMRDRGKYQGLIGASYTLATVIGPILGGYVVEHLSWRWIFYVNLPFGAIALGLMSALPQAQERKRHAIDYAGAALLALGLTSLILLLTLGGRSFAWSSLPILVLFALVPLSLFAFVKVEARAREPMLPLVLFSNRTFTVTNTIAFVTGLAMFGSFTFVPLYLQVAKGTTPSGSGFMLIPLIVGVFLVSLVVGRMLSAGYRYKPFPVAGTAIMAVSLVLMGTMTDTTSLWLAGTYAFFLGLGLGLVMQVLLIVVQNAVDYRYLGVASSATVLFRSIGGSMGVALCGAVFASLLHAGLLQLLPPGMDLATIENPSGLHLLPPDLRDEYMRAFTGALRGVFLFSAVVAAFAFALSWMLSNESVRGAVQGAGEALPVLRDATSLEELERMVTAFVAHENRWQVYIRIAERAGLDLSAGEVWLMARMAERSPITLDALAAELKLAPKKLVPAAQALMARRFMAEGPDGALALTDAGRVARERITEVRRRNLEEFLGRWEPEKHEEVRAMIRRIADVLVSDVPPHAPRGA